MEVISDLMPMAMLLKYLVQDDEGLWYWLKPGGLLWLVGWSINQW